MARRERMSRRGEEEREERRSRRGGRSRDRGGRSRDRDDDRRSRRGGGGFNYRERDPDSARSRAKGDGGGGFLKEGINRWSPRKGDNCIRILPPTWDKAEHFGYDVYAHYRIGPENKSFLSLKKMLDEDDPIWEEFAQAQSDGDEDYANELRPRRRVAYWLIDRDDERKGPQLWVAPYQQIDRELSKQMIDSRTGEVLMIDHPEEGYDVEFEKVGDKERTRYEGVRIARSSSDLGRDAEEWLDYIDENPIPDCLVYATYDEMADAFHARGSSGGDRSSRGSRGSSRRRGSDRDDDRSDSRRGRSRSRPGRGEEDRPTVSLRDLEDMNMEELEDVVMEHRLDLDPEEYDSEEELAAAIADELGLSSKRGSSRGRVRGRDERDEEEEEEDDRYDRMESRRGRSRRR